MAERLYKVTGEHGEAIHGGSGTWRLNRWRSVRGPLKPCSHGLHLCTIEQLPAWLGTVIWEVETDGEMIDAGDKTVARRARVVRRLDTWNDRTARLFAADCAEHVLPIFEAAYPNDARPREAIAVARRFANGEATRQEMAAAGAAAGAATWAAWAAGAAAGAATGATGAAAWAAGAAARAAELRWQSERLAAYLSGKIA